MDNKLYELNERLEMNNYDRVYEMEELDMVLQNYTPTQIIRMASKNFSMSHPYFEFDGYGNLESYENIETLLDLYIDIR